ncbi:MAG: hypothetical protein ACE5GV_10955 [Candidatus Scalindua sp.]
MKDLKKPSSLIFTFCRKIYLSLFIVLFLTGYNYSALGKELPAEQAKYINEFNSK